MAGLSCIVPFAIPMHRIVACLLIPLVAAAQDDAARADRMDYGPFLSTTVENPRGENSSKGKGGVADKGIVVRHGKREGATVFDSDTLRMAAAWTGGWLQLKGVAFDGAHGPNPGAPANAQVFYETDPAPGWCPNGTFAESRVMPVLGPEYAQRPLGPLPKSHAKYLGLFLHGERVIFHYRVGTAEVLESPDLRSVANRQVIVRELEVRSGTLAAWMNLADLPTGGKVEAPDAQGVAFILSEDGATLVAVAVGGLPAKRLQSGKRLALDARDTVAGTRLRIAYARGPVADRAALAQAARTAADSAPVDLVALTRGGPARWPATVEVAGVLGEVEQEKALARLRKASKPDASRMLEVTAAPYVVDSLPLPDDNPYNAWMRVGGLDFLAGNRAVISTWNGDVWISSPIDATLAKITWKRFATGIHHGLGLKVINEVIYVLGRDQITRLHDLNQDGEADAYECFNNDVMITSNFHEFAFELQVDDKGNLYFLKGGPVTPGGRGWDKLSPNHGCIFRLPPDGSRLDIIATGVRAPNGMSVGPNGEIVNGDNEGTWVPVDYLNVLPQPGYAVKDPYFLVVPDLSHRTPKPDKVVPRPLCWIPHDVDNSNGGQTWVTDDRWGPFKGRMLATSYGKSSLFLVLQERVGDVLQGGVIKFPLRFSTGIMRPRFSPYDGQLYIAGLKGWQSNAVRDGGLQRVRYTGKSVTLPYKLSVTDAGITVGFTGPLDAASASDIQNYSIEQNNYLWSSAYGSPEIKVGAQNAADKTAHGTTPVPIASVKLSADRKQVFLAVPGLKPVMMSRLKMNLKAEDGSRVPEEVIHTIHAVPPAAQPGEDVLSVAPKKPASQAGWQPEAVAVLGLLALGYYLFRRRFGCCGCGKCTRRS